MLLFVGLGNPGAKYARNRHNIGFMALDAIAREHRFPPFRNKFSGRVSEGQIAGERVVLLMPETYMNESGIAVGAAQRFHKIALADVVVFHDDPGRAVSHLRSFPDTICEIASIAWSRQWRPRGGLPITSPSLDPT